MTGTNDVSLRMARSRSRQAESYSRVTAHPQLEQASHQAGPRPVTLPTLKFGYGNRPVTYLNGRLMAGDEVVRIREGAQFSEVQP